MKKLNYLVEPPITHRSKRVAELLRRELSHLIQRRMHDPRLSMVTISEVEVSADLKLAKVYVSCLSASAEVPDDLHRELRILNRATGFLRRALGERVILRQIPQLKFVFDPGVAQGNRVARLLRAAEEKA